MDTIVKKNENGYAKVVECYTDGFIYLKMCFDFMDNLEKSYIYRYDEKNNITCEIITRKDKSAIIFDYDDKGNIIVRSFYNKNGNLVEMDTCNYDKSGDCISEKIERGSLLELHTFN